MEHVLVICNSSDADFLSERLGGSPSLSIITDDVGLESLTAKDVSDYDGVVVMAELLWRDHAPSDFYGMDVAVSLRLRLKILAPICIVSFMNRSFFASQEEVKYNILKARGTAFRRMPVCEGFLEDAFAGILPLSEATLAYLSNLLVDIQHIIDQLRHVLRMTSSHERILESLSKIDILSSRGIYPKAFGLSKEVEAAHSAGDEARFYKASGELVELLGTYWQSGRSSVQDDASRHRVILVDDNAEDLHWATSALAKCFEVIPFQDAMEAKRYIDADVGNEIAAVICDWQLLRPGTEEQQEMLGFELLEYAARKGHYALFSLTSTDDTSTLEVDQYLWFEHTLIAKDFHHDDALWKMYIPIIRQKIERTRAVIASLPTGEAWTSDFKLAYRKEGGRNVAYKQYYKSLKEQYIQERNSEGWHSFEAEVSSLSDNLWKYYRKAMSLDERPFLFDLKTQWGLELNRDLKNVLVIRRLFLAFWFNKTLLDISFLIPGKGIVEDPVINIYSVLRHRYFSELMEEKEDGDPARTYKDLNNAAKVFASQLAIEPARLPQGVLPEEKAWLKGQGIKTEGGNDNIY